MKTRVYSSIILVILLLGDLIVLTAQQHQIKFLKVTSDKSEIKKMYDSLMVPLLVYNNNIYTIDSECIPRGSAGASTDRNSNGANDKRNAGGKNDDRASGGATEDRDSGGKSDQRNAAGAKDKRKQAGASEDRKSGGAEEDRNSAGSSNSRNSKGESDNREMGGDSNQRTMDGSSLNFTCENSNGVMIIYFTNSKIDNSIKVYYNNHLYSSKAGMFKLKTL